MVLGKSGRDSWVNEAVTQSCRLIMMDFKKDSQIENLVLNIGKKTVRKEILYST